MSHPLNTVFKYYPLSFAPSNVSCISLSLYYMPHPKYKPLKNRNYFFDFSIVSLEPVPIVQLTSIKMCLINS